MKKMSKFLSNAADAITNSITRRIANIRETDPDSAFRIEACIDHLREIDCYEPETIELLFQHIDDIDNACHILIDLSTVKLDEHPYTVALSDVVKYFNLVMGLPESNINFTYIIRALNDSGMLNSRNINTVMSNMDAVNTWIFKLISRNTLALTQETFEACLKDPSNAKQLAESFHLIKKNDADLWHELFLQTLVQHADNALPLAECYINLKNKGLFTSNLRDHISNNEVYPAALVAGINTVSNSRSAALILDEPTLQLLLNHQANADKLASGMFTLTLAETVTSSYHALHRQIDAADVQKKRQAMQSQRWTAAEKIAAEEEIREDRAVAKNKEVNETDYLRTLCAEYTALLCQHAATADSLASGIITLEMRQFDELCITGDAAKFIRHITNTLVRNPTHAKPLSEAIVVLEAHMLAEQRYVDFIVQSNEFAYHGALCILYLERCEKLTDENFAQLQQNLPLLKHIANGLMTINKMSKPSDQTHCQKLIEKGVEVCLYQPENAANMGLLLNRLMWIYYDDASIYHKHVQCCLEHSEATSALINCLGILGCENMENSETVSKLLENIEHIDAIRLKLKGIKPNSDHRQHQAIISIIENTGHTTPSNDAENKEVRFPKQPIQSNAQSISQYRYPPTNDENSEAAVNSGTSTPTVQGAVESPQLK